MIPTGYFNAVIVGTMVSLAVGGLPTLAASIRQGEPQSLKAPSEPAFSVGLLLMYVPAVYGLAGALAIAVNTSNATVNAALLLLVALMIHLLYALGRRRSASSIDIGRAAGLTDIFESGSFDPLKRACHDDLVHAKKARLVAPNLQHLFKPGVAVGEALLEAMHRGLKLEALTDGRVSSASELKLSSVSSNLEIVGFDAADVSGHWFILSIGRVLYFGLCTDGVNLSEISMCRGISPLDKPSQIVDAVLSVLDGLFDRARKGENYSRVATSSSPKTYRERIVAAETGAQTIDRIPKRISVVFRGDNTIRSIATQRFGRGSPSFNEYIEEHRERCQEFFAGLARGMMCREIYNERELTRYIESKMHSNWVKLKSSEIVDTVIRWRQAIDTYQNYVVALTEDPIPFKYVLINHRLVVLHEAIGVNYLHRLNAISVEGKSAGEAFLSDFEAIWERVPPERRSKTWLLDYIDEVLLPLARGEKDASETK
jgi:hypothetical protein